MRINTCMTIHDVVGIDVEAMGLDTFNVASVKVRLASDDVLEIECYSVTYENLEINVEADSVQPLSEDAIRDFLANVNLSIIEKIVAERQQDRDMGEH